MFELVTKIEVLPQTEEEKKQGIVTVDVTEVISVSYVHVTVSLDAADEAGGRDGAP